MSTVFHSEINAIPIVNSSVKRGAFILFEGIDRCGKSTQCNLLQEASNKLRPTEMIRFPNRESTIGQLINSYLQSNTQLSDQSIHLLFSANRWESSKMIEYKLMSGVTLICDRYAYSGVAFTSAKGLSIEWCKACDIGLPAPDCIIYLDMSVEEAAQRGNYGEERYEKVEFQKKVRESFMYLKRYDTERDGDESSVPKIPWYILAANDRIEVIHAEIMKIVNQTVEERSHQNIEKLWI